MAVEEGGRWQIVCRHGVVVETKSTQKIGCVRVAEVARGPIATVYVSTICWIKYNADLKESRSDGRA